MKLFVSSTMHHSFLFVVALLLLTTTTTITVITAQEICTVCTEGNEMRYDIQLCNDLRPRTNGLYETDTDCQDLHLEAYQIGCCLAPPKGYCGYCADGSEPNFDGIIPTGDYVGGENCFDYAYQNKALIGMFSDGSCDDTFMRRAGYYCDCPNQKQECWLCPDGNSPSKPGAGEPWVTDSNCRGIEYIFSLLTEDECESFPMDAGADLAIYCGCGGLNQTEIAAQQEIFQCELCRNGGFVIDPDATYTTVGEDKFSKTCQQADDFARDIIKTPYGCNNQRYFGDAREFCCSNGSAATALLLPSSSWWSMVSTVTSSMSLLVAVVVAFN